IKKDTIDWGKNYDDKLDEPTVLPVKFPNLLVNGSVGIAVGMATNIPPHNLNEVCDAIVARMDNPECGIEEILQYIKGPDFPTGGIIMGYSGIRSAYYTGRGKITLRGKAEIVEEGNHSRIIVTEIPYMVNKSKLLETTGQLMRDKRIEGISNLRDESDKDGMRIVYELKRDVNAQVVLNKLYSFTQLQDTVGVIMIALVNGEPKQLTLLEILDNYIAFQKQIITRRTAFDLKKARERAHILQGFLLAIDNIDEVISILRSSKSVQEGKERLMERFKEDDLAKLLQRAMGENYKDVHFEHEIGLSEEQADAIVQMRLGQLTGLERDKVISELAEIMEKINDFLDILSSDERVKEIIKEEITAIKEKYGDERRTAIEPISGEVDIEDLIPEEECVLTYTNIGYIKRQPVDVYNLQKRGGKGVSGMKQREEDFVEDMFISSTHDNILFITNYGNMYKLKCYEVPEGSKQSRGTNIVNLLQLDEGERIAAMMKTSDFAENKYFICVTKYGKIKRTPLYDFRNVRKNGLRAITLAEGDEIAAAHLTEGDSSIIIATHLGMAIHFSEDKIRSMGRLAAGVRAIKLREDDYIVGAAKVYSDDMRILTVTDKGYGRLSALSDYRMQNRGGNGLKNYKIRDDRGYVCGIRSIQTDDDVILISTDGVIIRIRANDLRVMRRTGLGVRVMKLSDEDRVVTFTRTEHDETADIEEVEQASDEEIAAAEAEAEAEVIEDEPETNEEE
ncbi:MAG: DNA gyrase subunit A, partial [[Eubacterium] siraeum]